MTTDQNLWNLLSDKINNDDPKIRSAAIEELADHEEIQAVRLLLRSLNDLSAQNRQRAGELLLNRHHPAVVSGLIALLDSEKFHVRTTAAELLEHIPGESARKHIQEILEDPQLESTLRISLITLYCYHADETMLPRIEQFMREDSESVRKACLSGLCRASGAWVASYLISLIHSDDQIVSQSAAEYLIHHHSPEIVKHLITAMKTPGKSGDVAISILSQISDDSHYDEIAQNTRDADPLVRRRALHLLSAINANRAIQEAVQLLRDNEDEIRIKAMEILLARPMEVIIDLLQTMPDISEPDRVLLQNHAYNKLDNEGLIRMLETSRGTGLETLLPNRDPIKLLTILKTRLDTGNPDILTRQLALIGRLGRVESRSWLVNAKIPDNMKNQRDRTLAEIDLRDSLTREGFDHSGMSLSDICGQAEKNGWISPESIDEMLEVHERNPGLHDRWRNLNEDLVQQNKLQAEIESRLDQMNNAKEHRDRAGRTKLIWIFLLVASSVSTVLCLSMNWRYNAHPGWYPGLFVSVCILGLSVFILRKLPRQRSATAQTGKLSVSPESLMQQLGKTKESIRNITEEISSIELDLKSERIKVLENAFISLKDGLISATQEHPARNQPYSHQDRPIV